MRYGDDDRLYVPSRIRTRNKHRAEWLSKRGEQRNCLKHVVGTIDVLAISPTSFGKRLIFQLFPRIKRALEWRQDRMPFTIVVRLDCCGNSVDCHHERPSGTLNKIGVAAAAMMGEDVNEAVKSGSCEIVWSLKIHSKAYCSHKSWLSKEWTKGLQRKAWKASCSYRYWRGPLNHRVVNFLFVCWAFSLLELTICIEKAFYRNERYLFVTWFIIFLSRTRWNYVLKP